VSAALEEHHSYLSLAHRAELYHAAIVQALSPGDTVADLGCGFGVLGLYCLEAGASQVWGIDSTDAIDIAAQTTARMGYAERYNCLHERSFRAQLSEPVDLLICDHVGHFGLDYGIIAMLEDARRRLLKPGGRIIPQAIALQIAGVASPLARNKLDAWQREPVPPAYAWLASYAANTKHVVSFSPDDLATKPVALGRVDLATDSPAVLSFAASLEVTANGALDGLGGWFACELAPGVTMTNAPGAPERIDRSQVLLGFEVPLAVIAGDTIAVTVKFRHEDGILAWSAHNPRTDQRARQSTWASLPLSASARLGASTKAQQLSTAGRARAALLALIDGARTGSEIEAEMLRLHAALFPSEAELIRFTRDELARSTG
jgi:type I protein arginine methyltransferase